MSNKVKEIEMKNQTYYFFDDIINIENFNPNNIKIDEKLYKNILVCCIGYVTIKDSKLLYWICDDQRFKHKKIKCESFKPYFQQSQWTL